MRRLIALALVALPPLMAGCDLLGIEGASAVAARREAEGKAIGGACRHAARSIEQCYAANRKADKAAVFAGWREMNDYMRENKMEPMPATDATAAAEAEGEGEAAGNKPGTKDSPRSGAESGRGSTPARTAAAKPH
ncbi:MAG: hypothetical protein KIT17_07430 [Rubrivivax sp.]|nr:hypothetical protein [Rubrivivax sp.]